MKNKKCAYRSKRIKTQTPIVAKPTETARTSRNFQTEFAFYQIRIKLRENSNKGTVIPVDTVTPCRYSYPCGYSYLRIDRNSPCVRIQLIWLFHYIILKVNCQDIIIKIINSNTKAIKNNFPLYIFLFL